MALLGYRAVDLCELIALEAPDLLSERETMQNHETMILGCEEIERI